MTENLSGGLSPKYKNYSKQKCFIAYSEKAPWSVDLISTCEELLSNPKYDLEVDYARKHFASDTSLRQKALELIANARYGIYDISYWRQDEHRPWQIPRNVMIELGIAIALNRPFLMVRHASNRELSLPKGLQCLSDQILEFSGTYTLEKILAEHLSRWLNINPEIAWWNRYCHFGNKVCDYREIHPAAKQLGKKELCCAVADSDDRYRPDFRNMVDDVLERFGDVHHTYLDSLSLQDGYTFLLCSHCQMIRSSPFAIYQLNSATPAEAFISIGISLALETQFEYSIHRMLMTEDLKNRPSLLSDYEALIARNDKERKKDLKKFIPAVISKTRKASWRPRPLPFIENLLEQPGENEPESNPQVKLSYLDDSLYIENISEGATLKGIAEICRKYGVIQEVYRLTDSRTGRPETFAVVEMEQKSQAESCIEGLDSTEWLGRTLGVRKATQEELDKAKASSNNNPNEKLSSKTLSHRTRSSMNSRKVRIYELSKELDLENRDLLAVCEQLNISIKSHSSTISKSDADRIRFVAENYVPVRAPAKKTRTPNRGKPFTPKALLKKKQQILEIRKKRDRTRSTQPELVSVPHVSKTDVSTQANEEVLNTEKKQEQSRFSSRGSSTRLPRGKNSSIFIGNLSYQVTLEDLRAVFSEYGTVLRVSLPTDRQTGRKRGFGFVEMEDESSAESAINDLDGAEWMGRSIRVNKAKPRK